MRRSVTAVYNLGGGRQSNISMLEAIELCQQIASRDLDYEISGEARMGDHRWYISDFSDVERDYVDFKLDHGIESVLREVHDVNVEQWIAPSYLSE